MRVCANVTQNMRTLLKVVRVCVYSLLLIVHGSRMVNATCAPFCRYKPECVCVRAAYVNAAVVRYSPGPTEASYSERDTLSFQPGFWIRARSQKKNPVRNTVCMMCKSYLIVWLGHTELTCRALWYVAMRTRAHRAADLGLFSCVCVYAFGFITGEFLARARISSTTTRL